jgi:uracil-DNA glycosylase
MTASFYPPGWSIESDWTRRLEPHFRDPGFQALCQFVELQRKTHPVYPAPENVFSAFRLTSFAETKVVILGQDPYHGPGQAHGLSFSVEGDTKIPPSLRNIYRELSDDLGFEPQSTGNLSAWAQQGVFLMNAVLTVRAGEANSHRKQGWERFTDEVIVQLNGHPAGIVFILWGKPAEKKAALIDATRHAIITSPHPSPLSAHRGFFGSRPFSRANDSLRRFGRDEVNWCLS